MKRSLVLQPLSREHHTALSLANACQRAAQSGESILIQQTCQRALQLYANELDTHFNIEEQKLLPLLADTASQALAQRTLEDHKQIRCLLHGLQQHKAESLLHFGQILMAHVRFEERELFPVLEQYLNAAT